MTQKAELIAGDASVFARYQSKMCVFFLLIVYFYRVASPWFCLNVPCSGEEKLCSAATCCSLKAAAATASEALTRKKGKKQN